MTPTPLSYHWRCLDCGAHATGTQAEVKRAAEKHTKRESHSTTAGTTPRGAAS